MAYLNEFPHTEASKLNLDWLLEQYSTFNQRLAEIVQHFDESVEQMQSDILQFKGDYEREFNNFKNDITSLVNEYSDKVDSINDNIGGYVNEYLMENINTILEDNPVLDTIYQRVGVVEPSSSITISDLTSDIIDIVILDNSLNHARFFANNTTNNLISVTQDYTDVIIGERTLSVATLPQFTTRLMVTNVNNNVVISNSGSNNLTVYKKRFN